VRIAAGAASTPAGIPPSDNARAGEPAFSLYAWQAAALSAWRKVGRQGVVEAVTGTGKTMLGLAAAVEAIKSGGRVQIVVPGVELLEQWNRELQSRLPGVRVGSLGGGYFSDFDRAQVVVSIVNSAREYDLGVPPPESLLVADECHRYGSEANAVALDERFDRRLGLTATYDREDHGLADYLDPYFGGVCFRMGYQRAIIDEVTAHYRVALIPVRFNGFEQEEYDEANRAANRAQSWLIDFAGLPVEPFGEFMKAVVKLSEGGAGEATRKARSYLSNFARRRDVLANTESKKQKLAELVPAFRAAERSIVFTQSVDAALDSALILTASGMLTEATHSQLGRAERADVLERFATGRLSVICAPRILDEGVDVPAADLAVLVASSRTRRQMIQRMGRVLRRKPDGRLARFGVLYVVGSSEDPARGTHAEFLDEVTPYADDVRTFRPDSPATELCSFLNRFQARGRPSVPRMAEDQTPSIQQAAPSPVG
jgi:RNA polymerase primary sigma factor